MYRRVLFLLVQSGVVSPAIIDLDEVELKLFEVVVGIHLLVAIETDIRVSRVSVTDTAALTIACIAVDACLKAFGVNVVAHNLQSMRETLRVNANFSLCRAAILETVVDVDILVASILQAL